MGTLTQQQQQSLDGNHEVQEEQDHVSGAAVSAQSHAVDRFRGEAGRSARETAVVAQSNDSVGDSSTLCSDDDDVDDDDEEEETNIENSGGWVTNPSVSSTVVHKHQGFDNTNGYVVLPNSEPSNFGDISVANSTEVRVGNEINYHGPVTIHANHVVYTNPTPNPKDESRLDVTRASDNISDLSEISESEVNEAPNGSIFSQNTKLNKVMQWLWRWKRATLSCVLALILLAIVLSVTVYFTHLSDESVFREMTNSSLEVDCADSSDEDCSNGWRPSATIKTTQSPPTPTPKRPSVTPGTNTCRAPPQPLNGRWKLHRSQCSDGQDCNIPEGTELGLGSHLVYSCDSGYKIRGAIDVSCSVEGKWLNIPVCTAILCKALATVSTRAECIYNEEWIPCESPVPPKTRATLTCENSYQPETNILSGQRNNVRCNANGQWEPEPMRCVPVCGTLPVDYKPTTGYKLGGFLLRNITEFPWHASMYRGEPGKPKEYFCGASIIQENLLITAAYCVYNEKLEQPIDASKIYIVTENFFLYNFLDSNLVKKNQVKRIYIKRYYLGFIGNYFSDIAILELVTPFVFSSYLVPACIDTLSDRNVLEPDSYGKVVGKSGFGENTLGEFSPILHAVIAPIISLSQCRSAMQSVNMERYFTNDKFCAGYARGFSVYAGECGSGLVLKTNNLWYLRGVTSNSLPPIPDWGTPTCDNCISYFYSLYTEISRYISWIQDVITKIEQNQTRILCSEESQTKCSKIY